MAKPNRSVPVLCEFVSRRSNVLSEVKHEFFTAVSSALQSVTALCATELSKKGSAEAIPKIPAEAESKLSSDKSRGTEKRAKKDRPARQERQKHTEPNLSQIVRRYAKQYVAIGINETMKALERDDALLLIHVSGSQADAASSERDETVPSWYPVDAVLSACEARRVAAFSVTQNELDTLFARPLAVSRCTIVTFRRAALSDATSLFRAAVFGVLQVLDDDAIKHCTTDADRVKLSQQAADLFASTVTTTRTIRTVQIPIASSDRLIKRKQPQVVTSGKKAKKDAPST